MDLRVWACAHPPPAVTEVRLYQRGWYAAVRYAAPTAEAAEAQPAGDIVFVLVFATLWAWMEVEIEGKRGWAVDLPTGCAFLGWTWYHVSMNAIVLLVLQRGLRSVERSAGLLLQCLLFALYAVAWFVVEDVMWFILNPSYGIARYKKDGVPWHASKAWVGGTFVYNWVVLLCWVGAGALQLRLADSACLLRDLCVASAFVLSAVLASSVMPTYYNSPTVSNSGCYL